MNVLVTGSAGFIGFHVTQALLARGDTVIGIDNFNDYYDPSLKEARTDRLRHERYTLHRVDITDGETLLRIVAEAKPDVVCHLAAQAGVRYSIEHPQTYVQSNLLGFVNILEAMKAAGIARLVYASSSSVYGNNAKVPFSTTDLVDHPISIYAASKKANELIAHVYHHLYGVQATGLRYFTVYGPWGRPDMALFLFTKAMLEGRPIDVYNHGDMQRDFTYIDDIVRGTVAAIDAPLGFEILNIGQGNPQPLMRFIEAIERALGMTAQKRWLPMQPGDVPQTFADTTAIEQRLGYKPCVTIEEGVPRFVEWYQAYYASPATVSAFMPVDRV